MNDGRPNPNIWGNIITCSEIAIGIYEIIAENKKGLMIPKEIADEILPESVISQAEPDGGDLCFTDELSTALAVDELIRQELVTDQKAIAQLDLLRLFNEDEFDTGFEVVDEIEVEFKLDMEL